MSLCRKFLSFSKKNSYKKKEIVIIKEKKYFRTFLQHCNMTFVSKLEINQLTNVS